MPKKKLAPATDEAAGGINFVDVNVTSCLLHVNDISGDPLQMKLKQEFVHESFKDDEPITPMSNEDQTTITTSDETIRNECAEEIRKFDGTSGEEKFGKSRESPFEFTNSLVKYELLLDEDVRDDETNGRSRAKRIETLRSCGFRSAASIASALTEKEEEFAIDVPSDEDDAEEKLTDSDSEQEADDFHNDVAPQEDSDNGEVQDRGGPSVSKRRRKNQGMAEATRRDRGPSTVDGKNGYRWYTAPQKRSQAFPSSSILPEPIGKARDVTTCLEAWNLLFDENLLRKIMFYTNEEIERYRNSAGSENAYNQAYKDVDLPELKAFIGLMYFSGMQKTGGTNIQDLWSHEYGSQIYRATMQLERFKILFSMLRFDGKCTRVHRRETEKFAPIREVWNGFISNCSKYYNPAAHCTIGEQLLFFQGRCPFKVCGDSKPDKCGVKIVMLNDATTFYMYSAEPYLGRVNRKQSESVPSYYIRKLSQSLHGTRRNITCNNWYSSVEIFEKMLRHHSITMVGALRKNDPGIPDTFRHAGQVHSAKFVFSDTQTLVSYTPRKNKILILLSTLHRTSAINSETKMPEIVEFYNTTKGGTDSFDQMCQEYTTARKSLRWPMRLWMGMLDQGGINAMILYNFNSGNTRLCRREFLKSLIIGLIEPHLRIRIKSPFLRRDLRFSIQNILQMGAQPPTVAEGPFRRSRCVFCPRAIDKKVRVHCNRCNRPVCEEHRRRNNGTGVKAPLKNLQLRNTLQQKHWDPRNINLISTKVLEKMISKQRLKKQSEVALLYTLSSLLERIYLKSRK